MKLKCRLLGHKIKESDIRYCNGEPNEEWREAECIVCRKTLQIENNGRGRDKFVITGDE